MPTSGLGMSRLAINDRVTIQIGNETYPSRVEDRMPDTLTLTMPLAKGKLVIPSMHTPVYLIFDIPGVGPMLQETVVLAQRFQLVPMFVVGRPDRVQAVFNRQYYRLPLDAEVTLWCRDAAGKQEAMLVGRTRDVSGGGMRIALPGHPQGHVTFALPLPRHAGMPIMGEAEILEIVPGPEADHPACEARLRFRKLERGDQDRLLRYIFQRQREQQQKRLT